VKGGEAYMRAGRDATRTEILQAGHHGVIVREGEGREELAVLPGGRTPAGWRLAGLSRPSARTWDGHEAWRVPGPPWGAALTWAGPGAPLVLHGTGERPGWLGPDIGPVSEACADLAAAQAAADAWWLSETSRLIAASHAGGQASLFGAADAA